MWTRVRRSRMTLLLLLLNLPVSWWRRLSIPTIQYKTKYQQTPLQTSNNQRLRSAGDNDRRSKGFCSIAALCVCFTWKLVKTRVIRLRVREGPNARDQIPFIPSESPNECWLHTCDACLITTWRLGLQATRGARKYSLSCNCLRPVLNVVLLPC